MPELLKQYGLYVALYLGVALTGGSIVHLPLAPVRYAVIGAVGIAVFIVASVADARRRHAAGLEGPGGGIGRYVGWSVLLSLGLGMLSGAIQHFLDSPRYAAALIPLGFLLSLVAYAVRERLLPAGGAPWRAAGAAVAVAALLHLGLAAVSGHLEALRGWPHPLTPRREREAAGWEGRSGSRRGTSTPCASAPGCCAASWMRSTPTSSASRRRKRRTSTSRTRRRTRWVTGTASSGA
jgi:hypothetical protein